MAMKISISFKDHEKEMYEFLKGQMSPSMYIKMIIKEKMESEVKPNKPQQSDRKSTNFMDF